MVIFPYHWYRFSVFYYVLYSWVTWFKFSEKKSWWLCEKWNLRFIIVLNLSVMLVTVILELEAFTLVTTSSTALFLVVSNLEENNLFTNHAQRKSFLSLYMENKEIIYTNILKNCHRLAKLFEIVSLALYVEVSLWGLPMFFEKYSSCRSWKIIFIGHWFWINTNVNPMLFDTTHSKINFFIDQGAWRKLLNIHTSFRHVFLCGIKIFVHISNI